MIFGKQDNTTIITKDLTFKIIMVENYMRRHSSSMFVYHGGWGNGYVCLTRLHDWFKKDYDDINEHVYIHGGLTFSEYDEEEDLWVIGFDTNHYDDNDIVWHYNAVVAETKRLEKQCADPKYNKMLVRLAKIKKLKKLIDGK